MENSKIKIDEDFALLIVDMQYDFLPGGSLPVAEGDTIIDGINKIAEIFHLKSGKIIFTQDWHPPKHKSFASAYPDKKPGNPIQGDGLGPILWPDHCVQNSKGAEIVDSIKKELGICIIRKGYHTDIDSYSGFFDNDRKTKTGLAGYLKDLHVNRVAVCGLALDYCCFYTAMDAKKEGFDVFFIKDLSKGIDQPPGNIEKSLKKMSEIGIRIISIEDLI